MNDELRSFFVELAERYGEEKIRLLAERIDGAKTMEAVSGRVSDLAGWIERPDLDRLRDVCRSVPDLDPKLCAESLRTAALAMEKAKNDMKVALVWTGPDTSFVHPRKTESVMLETIGRAKKSLFLVSYVAYDVDSIVVALRQASERGVKVEILMESTGEYGGRINMDSIGLFRKELPDATLYWWNEPGASVHAKCVVADGEVAFVTSANLTGAAMERNMELGVSIEGGDVPRNLHDHLRALVDTGVIERVE